MCGRRLCSPNAGSSFTSNALDALIVNGTRLYMRGASILEALLGALEESYGMLSVATEVVVSGTSAGGLAALLHTGAGPRRVVLWGSAERPVSGRHRVHQVVVPSGCPCGCGA